MGLSWLSQRDLVLVLVHVIVVTSSAIELTGDNVCHRVENYTISVKESYMEPVVVNTFAWCLQIPPRCPQSRVEMRERWRLKTETKQRKIMECCEGYVVKKNEEKLLLIGNLEIAMCEPHCDICEHGQCVAPNTCQCGPGHRGDGCAYECPSGTWGEKCTRACDCQPGEKCNPVDGKCHCPSGWQGSGCKVKCPTGVWGINCGLSCACNNENDDNDDRLSLTTRDSTSVCHHETGSCMNFQQITVPFVPEIMTNNRADPTGNRSNEITTLSPTAAFVPSSTTKSLIIDDRDEISTISNYYDIFYSNEDSADKTDEDAQNERILSGKNREIDHDQPVETSTSNESSLSETSSGQLVPEIVKIETSTIATSIGTNKYGNYNVQQRVEGIDAKLPRVKKPSTPGPIVAVVHVSGNSSPDHDGPMIMTSLGTVPMPLDVAALIVIGSVISLGLTTLAVLAILHIRSKLFETIRMSIYDAEKRDTRNDSVRRGGGEKSSTISSIGRNGGILACEYETPKCMIPEHRTLTRPRPASSDEVTKKPNTNSTYSNDYPNIRLFSNIQELLEAHYDRPPSTFRHAVLDVDGEHVYDEIPLQSSTTFATTKRDS